MLTPSAIQLSLREAIDASERVERKIRGVLENVQELIGRVGLEPSNLVHPPSTPMARRRSDQRKQRR